MTEKVWQIFWWWRFLSSLLSATESPVTLWVRNKMGRVKSFIIKACKKTYLPININHLHCTGIKWNICTRKYTCISLMLSEIPVALLTNQFLAGIKAAYNGNTVQWLSSCQSNWNKNLHVQQLYLQESSPNKVYA